jgi:ubiquinone/menaquinone biosynthesis C-methylase UbiE
MSNKFTEEEIQEIASQLSHPNGEFGLQVAKKMEEGNLEMTLKAIEALDLSKDDRVLEIGHGNASHLKIIMDSAENLHYTGADISELMNQEAQKINSGFIEIGKASFYLYDGKSFPFDGNAFDKIMSVNTLYFWEKPLEFLNEIYRVLKPSGLFVLCFGQKSTMQNFPFTKYGFELYDTQKLQSLIEKSNFKIKAIHDHRDVAISKTGEKVERDFSVFVLKK